MEEAPDTKANFLEKNMQIPAESKGRAQWAEMEDGDSKSAWHILRSTIPYQRESFKN